MTILAKTALPRLSAALCTLKNQTQPAPRKSPSVCRCSDGVSHFNQKSELGMTPRVELTSLVTREKSKMEAFTVIVSTGS